MFDYLQKFNNLPKELRDKVSSPEVMNAILDLENKYGIELAALIMKVMIKEIPIDLLSKYLASEFMLPADKSKELSRQLFFRVFSSVASYLGITEMFKKNKEENEIEDIINQAGIMMPNSELLERLKKILLTFKKGVRDKINTKNSLAKPVNLGGLGLSSEEVDKLFAILEIKDISNIKLQNKEDQHINTSRGKLDKIIRESEGLSAGYDFKKSLAEKCIETSKDELEKIESPSVVKNLPLDDEDELLPLNIKKSFLPEQKDTLNLPLDDEDELLPLNIKKSFLPEQKDTLNLPLEEIVEENKVSEKSNIKDFKKTETLKTSIEEELKKDLDNINKNSKENKEVVKEELNKEVVKEDIKKTEKFKTSIEEELKKDLENINKNSVENKEVVAEELNKEVVKEDVKKSEIKTNINKEINNNQKTQTQKHFVAVNPDFKRSAPRSFSSRPRLDDIKEISKIMTPVEELKYLTLVNFRRLGKTPVESCERILNKIKLLEKDGYDRMIEGVKAWHVSEVNQLYVKIGRESLLNGLTLREAVVRRQTNSLPCLKEAEIYAIANLNGKLVF